MSRINTVRAVASALLVVLAGCEGRLGPMERPTIRTAPPPTLEPGPVDPEKVIEP